MSVEEIAALPVRELAEVDAHLYLWTTNRHITDAYDVAEAWGFTPSTLVTWCKAPRGIGLGGAFTLTTEHFLFARRGTLPPLHRLDTSWFQWKRPHNNHSAKPDAFLDVVEQISPEPRLEMFSRRARIGWDTWGDQALHGTELVA